MEGKKVMGEKQNDEFANFHIFFKSFLNFGNVTTILFSTWHKKELYHKRRISSAPHTCCDCGHFELRNGFGRSFLKEIYANENGNIHKILCSQPSKSWKWLKYRRRLWENYIFNRSVIFWGTRYRSPVPRVYSILHVSPKLLGGVHWYPVGGGVF